MAPMVVISLARPRWISSNWAENSAMISSLLMLAEAGKHKALRLNAGALADLLVVFAKRQ